jgi:hypothetical protein
MTLVKSLLSTVIVALLFERTLNFQRGDRSQLVLFYHLFRNIILMLATFFKSFLSVLFDVKE